MGSNQRNEKILHRLDLGRKNGLNQFHKIFRTQEISSQKKGLKGTQVGSVHGGVFPAARYALAGSPEPQTKPPGPLSDLVPCSEHNLDATGHEGSEKRGTTFQSQWLQSTHSWDF